MNKSKKSTLLYTVASIMLSFLLGACNDDPFGGSPIDIQLTRSESDAVKAVNDFTFDLLKATENRFSAENPNYIMSPQSVAWSIAMLANGAEQGSKTLSEMLDVLHLGNDVTIQDVNDYSKKLIEAITKKNGSADVSIANLAYFTNILDTTPFEEYSNTIKTFYNAESMVHATNDNIDSWISKKTGGEITNFAKSFNAAQYDFGILNTILFAGKWEELFDPSKTKNKDFHNADGTTSQTLMMTSPDLLCDVAGDDICDVMKVYFNKRYFSITFVIPSAEHQFSELLDHLNAVTWQNLSLKAEFRSVIIPKLNLKSEFNFIDVINDMGIRRAFSKESELKGIAQDGDGANKIILKTLNQRSSLNLDEEGVKVKTVTKKSGELEVTAAWHNYFFLDEPFYYFITEESTGAILFAGKVSQL